MRLECPINSNENQNLDGELSGLLQARNVSPQSVIERLKQLFDLGDLFEALAGIGQDLTIEDHTIRVMENVSTVDYSKFEIPFLKTMELKGFMLLIAALHDIGKPIAISTSGDSEQQHFFTLPILRGVLQKLGFSKYEVELSMALVGSDTFGELFQGKVTTKVAKKQLQVESQELGLSLATLFGLKLAFYTSDAGAYNFLCGMIFVERENVGLVPKGKYAYLTLDLARSLDVELANSPKFHIRDIKEIQNQLKNRKKQRSETNSSVDLHSQGASTARLPEGVARKSGNE